MKQWVAAFVAKRPVIVFDQQGHGRTADTPRTMSYEQFGDDAAALLNALEIERADVMGYSQGGGVALQPALRHPQLVSKLVTFSATARVDGLESGPAGERDHWHLRCWLPLFDRPPSEVQSRSWWQTASSITPNGSSQNVA
jgi:pimeloyl-ACP methyl ester carboxylesterase